MIDRYSFNPPKADSGHFFGELGASFDSRALPPQNLDTHTLYEYRGARPLPVESGPAAPWFGQTGGAVQYRTQMSTQELIRLGYLEEIK